MIHEEQEGCIEVCHDCAVVCEHSASLGLHEADVAPMAACIEVQQTCAVICSLAAAELARDSAWALRVCQLCADVCDACALECEKHSHDHCRVCAVVCRSCAETCREMTLGVAEDVADVGASG